MQACAYEILKYKNTKPNPDDENSKLMDDAPYETCVVPSLENAINEAVVHFKVDVLFLTGPERWNDFHKRAMILLPAHHRSTPVTPNETWILKPFVG